MSTLEQSEALAASVAKTGNRITLEDLKAQIVAHEFHWPVCCPHLTIAVLVCKNGFTLVGKSAPADPANFDIEAGRRFAYDDALRQLWALEGYRLRCQLMAEVGVV